LSLKYSLFLDEEAVDKP